MAKPELLYEVRLLETEKNSVVYRGRQTMIYSRNGKRQVAICGSMSSDSD